MWIPLLFSEDSGIYIQTSKLKTNENGLYWQTPHLWWAPVKNRHKRELVFDCSCTKLGKAKWIYRTHCSIRGSVYELHGRLSRMQLSDQERQNSCLRPACLCFHFRQEENMWSIQPRMRWNSPWLSIAHFQRASDSACEQLGCNIYQTNSSMIFNPGYITCVVHGYAPRPTSIICNVLFFLARFQEFCQPFWSDFIATFPNEQRYRGLAILSFKKTYLSENLLK